MRGSPRYAAGWPRPFGAIHAWYCRAVSCRWFASYLVDPHGSGGSSAPADPASYSPEGHARFYEEVRAALGLDEVILIGHSFGATTALTYAALFPNVADRVIAIAAFGMGTEVDESQGGAAAVEMGQDARASRGV